MKVKIQGDLPTVKAADSPVGPVMIDSLTWQDGKLRIEGHIRTPVRAVTWALAGSVQTEGQVMKVVDVEFTGAGPLNSTVRKAFGNRDERTKNWRIHSNHDGTEITVEFAS